MENPSDDDPNAKLTLYDRNRDRSRDFSILNADLVRLRDQLTSKAKERKRKKKSRSSREGL